MAPGPSSRPRLGRILKTARRLLRQPDQVHVIYDRDGHLVRPRPPHHIYRPIEAVLTARDADYGALVGELAPYLDCAGLDEIPERERDARAPYWRNGYFSGIDARAAYALAALRKPRRIVEIGSGHSTRFFRKAIRDHGFACTLTAIDPKPRAEVAEVADEVLRANVLDAEAATFAALGAGDILFIDGSHRVFNGTDTTRLFLEVLPTLAPGVMVHVHDICLPYEYGTLFTERLYGEQYLLACTILDTGRWRPLLPVYYLVRQGVFADLPKGEIEDTSFWMTAL